MAGPFRSSTAFANVAASATDLELVPILANTVIRVTGVVMMAGATATNVTFNTKSQSAGTPISPLFATGANGGAALPYMEDGWFDTLPGQALTVTTGSGSAVGVIVKYFRF
jgi:hypothetical protein